MKDSSPVIDVGAKGWQDHAAAIHLSHHGNATLAAHQLRGTGALSRELRLAIADKLEGKIKGKPGPKPKDIFSEGTLYTELTREALRTRVKREVAAGVPRNAAIKKLASDFGVSFDKAENFLQGSSS